MSLKNIYILFSLLSCIVNGQVNNVLFDLRDSSDYKIFNTDTQVWMSQNLKFNSPSKSLYFNNDTNFIKNYGRLYSFESATKVCPLGYHLPSKEEWEMLLSYLGAKEKKKCNLFKREKMPLFDMKSKYYLYKKNFEDTIDFNLVYGGWVENENRFLDLEKNGYYWTSTQYEKDYIYIINFDYDSKICTIQELENNTWNFYLSVRCVKDTIK